jgi:hypothetical protein
MTQEEKQLLLVDLSARLTYGVKISVNDKVESLQGINILDNVVEYGSFLSSDIKEVKPYLFPLSSMTKEQSKIYHELIGGMFGTSAIINFEALEDFFNKNHIDYRGLIPMGIALDATGKNIY